MTNIPILCPCCKSNKWVDAAKNITKSGYSVGKAVVGGVLLGPVGLLAGAFGKKHKSITMVCQDCHFSATYQVK